MRNFTGQSEAARQLFHEESELMEECKLEILAKLADLRDGKTRYDMHFPWWQKHVFGDASYAHEIFKKAARLCSLVACELEGVEDEGAFVDSMDDHLYDILNFTVMWLAWRMFRDGQARKEEPDEGSTHYAEATIHIGREQLRGDVFGPVRPE